ncbi:MAG: hypothetical protein L0241_14675 [Planctomycetia bacterium]|nr:hypothetical protein [Planctomycetia bacterium]
MKRFAIAAALALVIGLGTAATADAQYVQRYGTITPNGGYATVTNVYGFGAYQTYQTYSAPFGTVGRRTYYTDVFGNSYGQSYRYNSWSGIGNTRGFYQPSPYVNPYGGYYYNFYGYRR